MPDKMILKRAIRKDDNNALKKIQWKHVAVDKRGKETAKVSTIKANALTDSGAEIQVIREKLIEGMNLEQVGGVNLQYVAEEAITGKLVKVDVRLCQTPSDTEEEIRANQVKFKITPYVTFNLSVYCEDGKYREILTTARDHRRIKRHSTSDY